MHLTTLSDYALRLLIYAAAHDRLVTIEEVAGSYGISRAHLMKVANVLTRAGYLKAVRGRTGGLTLAKARHQVNLGDVLRTTEPDFALVECFATGNQCTISGYCRLPKIFNEALTNFLATFDAYTLADVALQPPQVKPPFDSAPALRGPLLSPRDTLHRMTRKRRSSPQQMRGRRMMTGAEAGTRADVEAGPRADVEAGTRADVEAGTKADVEADRPEGTREPRVRKQKEM